MEMNRYLIALGIWDFARSPENNNPRVENSVESIVGEVSKYGYERLLSTVSSNPSRVDLAHFEAYCRRRAAEIKERSGLLIVYVSSHGEAHEGSHYIYLSDHHRDWYSSTTIETAVLASLLARAQFEAVLLIVDTCAAGAATSSIIQRIADVVEDSGTRMAVIATAGRIQTSDAGVFSNALMKSLATAQTALKCGGPSAEYISLEGLVSLVNQALPARTDDIVKQRVRLLTLSDGVLPFFPRLNSGVAVVARAPVAFAPNHAAASNVASFETWLSSSEPAVRDVLTALAFTRGQGLPFDDILPAVAAAIRNRAYSDRDIEQVLMAASGYVKAREILGRTVYTLAHAQHADYLRQQVDTPCTHRSIATALAALSTDLKWAHPYVRRHLGEHQSLGSIASAPAASDSRLQLKDGEPRERFVRRRLPRSATLGLSLAAGCIIGAAGATGLIARSQPKWMSAILCEETRVDPACDPQVVHQIQSDAEKYRRQLERCRDPNECAEPGAVRDCESARERCVAQLLNCKTSTATNLVKPAPAPPPQNSETAVTSLGAVDVDTPIALSETIFAPGQTIKLRLLPAPRDGSATITWVAIAQGVPQPPRVIGTGSHLPWKPPATWLDSSCRRHGQPEIHVEVWAESAQAGHAKSVHLMLQCPFPVLD
jgi:hypothetical protein